MAGAGTINLGNLAPGDDPYTPKKPKTPPDPLLGGGGAGTGTGGRAPLPTPIVDQGGDGIGGGGPQGAPGDPNGDPNYDPYHGLGESGGPEAWTGADLGHDPGYQFRLKEAQRAQDNLNAQRGNFYSGGALKEALRLSQGMASDEADRAFGRRARKKTIKRS